MDKENNLFEEYLKSARDLILERVSSPFVFSFVISWLISNYKIVMVILTDQTAYYLLEYKIWLVNEYINYCNCLVYPLIGAILYTFVYPFADRKIATFTLNRKLEKRQAIHAIEKTELKTVEEVEAIHRRHFEVEQSLRNQIEQARVTEEQLRTKIQELEKNDNKLLNLKADEIKNPTLTESKLIESNETYIVTDIDESVFAILGSYLDRNIQSVKETDIHETIKQMNIPYSKVKLSLALLREKGYIGRDGYGGYYLSTKGLEIYNNLSDKVAQQKS